MDYIASNDWMTVNHKLEMMWKEAAVPYVRYYPGISLGGLTKITKPSVTIFGVPTKFRTDTSQIQVRSITAYSCHLCKYVRTTTAYDITYPYKLRNKLKQEQTIPIRPIWPIYRFTGILFEGSTTFVLRMKTIL
jgi:hypothetical protein